MDSVLTCMVSDRIDHGKITEDFISDLRSYLRVEGGIGFRDYGRAIETAITEMELTKGAKVIISPLSPRIYWDILNDMEIEMVFPDVDPKSGCLYTEGFTELKIDDIDAIIVTYPLGYVPEIQRLVDLGIPVLEDISQGLGSNNGEKKAGSFGSYVIAGLEPDHIITAGGGCVLYARGRRNGAALKRMANSLPKEVLLPDMNSSLGIIQVKELEKYIVRRRDIAVLYSRSLMQSRHRMLTQVGDAENIYYTFPVLLETGMKEVSAFAKKNGIETAPAFKSTILEYILLEEDQNIIDIKNIPNAMNLYLRTIAFPLYPMLGIKESEKISKVLTSLP